MILVWLFVGQQWADWIHVYSASCCSRPESGHIFGSRQWFGSKNFRSPDISRGSQFSRRWKTRHECVQDHVMNKRRKSGLQAPTWRKGVSMICGGSWHWSSSWKKQRLEYNQSLVKRYMLETKRMIVGDGGLVGTQLGCGYHEVRSDPASTWDVLCSNAMECLTRLRSEWPSSNPTPSSSSLKPPDRSNQWSLSMWLGYQTTVAFPIFRVRATIRVSSATVPQGNVEISSFAK